MEAKHGISHRNVVGSEIKSTVDANPHSEGCRAQINATLAPVPTTLLKAAVLVISMSSIGKINSGSIHDLLIGAAQEEIVKAAGVPFKKIDDCFHKLLRLGYSVQIEQEIGMLITKKEITKEQAQYLRLLIDRQKSKIVSRSVL